MLALQVLEEQETNKNSTSAQDVQQKIIPTQQYNDEPNIDKGDKGQEEAFREQKRTVFTFLLETNTETLRDSPASLT